MMELLAPAGSLDAAMAALHYGADAVYLGLQRFSARADATNFSWEELSQLLDIAHGMARPRRVYAAVNTVLQEAEIPDAAATLVRLQELGVDAVIVQDLGVAAVARRVAPGMLLHASTQMAIHSAAGVAAARELGIERVILARELTLPEIAECSEVSGMETEVFVYGALCYGYSGLCLLSSHLRGASGNRGNCAYICRQAFADEGAPGPRRAIMSMRDLSIVGRIPELAARGVTCVKIEGRKKTPLYVAAVTHYCRGVIDGTLDPSERAAVEHHLRIIFSRPWTDFHLDGRQGPPVTDTRTVGHRGSRIGTVREIIAGTPDLLVLDVERPIERHDGLQLEPGGWQTPYGFSARELFVVRRGRDGPARVPAFRIEGGQCAAVELPDGHPSVAYGDPVFTISSQEVKRLYRWPTPNPARHRVRHAVDVELTIGTTSLRAVGTVHSPLGDVAAAAEMVADDDLSAVRNPGALERAATKAFRKLGDTDLVLRSLRLHNPDNRFVPVSMLNDLRRGLGEAGEAALTAARRRRGMLPTPGAGHLAPASAEPQWLVKTDDPAAVSSFTESDWCGVSELVVDIDAAGSGVAARLACEPAGEGDTLPPRRWALPVIMRSADEARLSERVGRLLARGECRWQVAGLAGLRFLRDRAPVPEDLDLTADWSLYAMNSHAVAQLLDLGFSRAAASPEDTRDNLLALAAQWGERLEIPVYQDTTLCLSAACARASRAGECLRDDCPGDVPWRITDGGGTDLTLVTRHCTTAMVGTRAFSLSGHLGAFRDVGTRLFRADFLWRRYDPDEALRIWRRLRCDEAIPETHTGNFSRPLA